jgi:hypothetical protein
MGKALTLTLTCESAAAPSAAAAMAGLSKDSDPSDMVCEVKVTPFTEPN